VAYGKRRSETYHPPCGGKEEAAHKDFITETRIASETMNSNNDYSRFHEV